MGTSFDLALNCTNIHPKWHPSDRSTEPSSGLGTIRSRPLKKQALRHRQPTALNVTVVCLTWSRDGRNSSCALCSRTGYPVGLGVNASVMSKELEERLTISGMARICWLACNFSIQHANTAKHEANYGFVEDISGALSSTLSGL